MENLPTLPGYTFEANVRGLVSLALAIVLPIIAGLFMKAQWTPTAKGTVLLFVAAVKTYLEMWLAAIDQSQPFNFVDSLYGVVINFVIAVAFYFGWLQKSAIQQAALRGGVVPSDTGIRTMREV